MRWWALFAEVPSQRSNNLFLILIGCHLNGSPIVIYKAEVQKQMQRIHQSTIKNAYTPPTKIDDVNAALGNLSHDFFHNYNVSRSGWEGPCQVVSGRHYVDRNSCGDQVTVPTDGFGTASQTPSIIRPWSQVQFVRAQCWNSLLRLRGFLLAKHTICYGMT